MSYLYPFERRLRRRRRIVWMVTLAIVFLLLLLIDRSVYFALAADRARLERKDWYRTFRVVGSLYPWIFICAAIALHGAWLRGTHSRILDREQLREHGRQHIAAGALIFLAAAAAGLIAEILQVLVGRLRPDETDGRLVFRGLLERFTNSDGLGFPSSHTAVAFGAAFMVWFFYPAPGVIALLAAALCGLTRLLAGAHFLTDVFAAALVGYAMARLLRPGSWMGLKRGRMLP